MQQKRKKALLDTGVEGLKERREEARKEGKERMKKTFGEGKVSQLSSLFSICMDKSLILLCE